MIESSDTTRPSILPFVWQHAWHHSTRTRLLIVFGFACSLAACLCNLAIPYIASRFIDAITHPSAANGIWQRGWWVVLGVLLFQVVMYRTRVWIYWRMVMPQMLARMRTTLFNRMLRHGTDFFANQFSGALANKIRLVADGTETLFEDIAIKLFEAMLYLVAACFILSRINADYTIAIVVSLFIIAVCGNRLSRRCNQLAEVKANTVSNMAGFLVDTITNLTAVRHFVGWNMERHLFAEHQNRVVQASRDLSFAYGMIWGVFGVMTSIMQAVLFWIVARDFQQGLISVGDITLIVMYGGSMTRQFSEMLFTMPKIATSIGNINEALDLIYQPVQHSDAPDAQELIVRNGTIDFAHVNFAYPNGTHVFHDLNLHIPGGQKVGLVGFSGSGKSTFVHLLLRHYDIQSGSIAIDEQRIETVTMDSLRASVAHVPQDSVLFHRSLYDNIAYGRHGASSHEVMEAAQRASAHEFIEELQDTYYTKVGERGVKLSGGQRQRIAIARAILSDAPILILDEATSALDSVTEKLIQDVLQAAMQDRTTIVIAHRLATLKNLDRLIVLDQGKIIEDGTLDELLAKGGHFAMLWAMQLGGFLPDQR